MIIFFDLEIFFNFEKESIEYPIDLEKYTGHRIKSLYLDIYNETTKTHQIIYETFDPHLNESHIDYFLNKLFDIPDFDKSVWMSYESHYYFEVIKAICFKYNKISYIEKINKVKYNDFILSQYLGEKRACFILKKKKDSDEYREIIFDIINAYVNEKTKKDADIIDANMIKLKKSKINLAVNYIKNKIKKIK